MLLTIETPTRVYIPDALVTPELRDYLTYEDASAQNEYRRWASVLYTNNRRHWFAVKYGWDALEAKVHELAQQTKKCVLYKEDGRYYTHSGLASELAEKLGVSYQRTYTMPSLGYVDYITPPYESRYYQAEAEEVLANAGHAGVELATGLGKSLIIAKLAKRIGLPAVIIAPTISIATQLYLDLVRLFGKSKVGQFFDGKKEVKFFIVAVNKSLTSLDESSPLYGELTSTRRVIIGDECHLLPAETLSKVVLDMFSAAEYRFFLSGTHIRGDGKELILRGITGPVLMRMDVREGVDQGFLARPKFTQFQIDSPGYKSSGDVIALNRFHLHKNTNVYGHVGAIVNAAVAKGRRPLILLDEVSQFIPLIAELRCNVGFAHGGASDFKNEIDAKYHKPDNADLVRAFDAREIDVLVGTSCIATGTDIKTADFVIDLVGLASEVRLRQAVGRGTRRGNGKTTFDYIDYCVRNVPALKKHGAKRKKIMEQIYGPVRIIDL